MMETITSKHTLQAVPVTQVQFTDQFWTSKIEINRTKTLAQCFRQCEETNRIRNFEVAGGLNTGDFDGIFFNDSDVYKVVEGAAHILASNRDPAIETQLDQWIAKFAAAQQADGYLNTYYTLVEPDKRWTDLPVMHELYCAGHLFEAAVAHYRSTGKSSLLDIATKFADYIDSVFGPGGKSGTPGHQEIELALVKLYEVTDEKRYLDLAAFFIDQRGQSGSDYSQDHVPVRQQSEIVGHAVRAMYLYAGVADVARYTGDEDLFACMDRIWKDVTLRKMYITGGIGPSGHNEGFTVPYDLPNETAYAETCAAIGMVLWSHRMFLLHGRSEYIDVLEQSLYNGLLSGVSLDGDNFFYTNPLSSHGQHHRQPWFGCACCPTNVVRFIPQVGGYFYASTASSLWVNLYASNQATVSMGEQMVNIHQESNYPWQGWTKLTLEPDKTNDFQLCLRQPNWAKQVGLKLNGQILEITSNSNGYLEITRAWRAGDVVEVNFDMSVERIIANPQAKANNGKLALRRGPLVYCLEATDNDGSVRDIALPRNSPLKAKFEPNLLDGVVILQGPANRRISADWGTELYKTASLDQETQITAIPYFAWDNRESGQMAVWLPESTILTEPKLQPSIASQGRPSASHVFGQLSAAIDGILPASSADQTHPKFTWWDKKGTQEWICLTFNEPVQISESSVYWFDDTGFGECRPPESWWLEWDNSGQWQPVKNPSKYGLQLDGFNSVTFDPVTTQQLRIVVELQDNLSSGLLEWLLN